MKGNVQVDEERRWEQREHKHFSMVVAHPEFPQIWWISIELYGIDRQSGFNRSPINTH
jgi:hypothetical protein